MGGQDGSLETARVELRDVAAQQDFLSRCERASRLTVHPHLVTIQDHGLAPDGAGYLATDPPPGRSLADGLSRDGAFALAASLRLGIALAGALQTVHQAGLVHGAVSPGTIFLSSTREPVLANLIRAESWALGAGAPAVAAGTSGDDGLADALDHAPPEVLHGGLVTPTADVYSLASTVYTMVAGRTPDAARALVAVGAGPAESEPTAVALPPIGGKIPVELEDALAKALVPDPTVRTPTAAAFAEAMQEIQRQLRHPVTEMVVTEVHEPDVAPDGTAYTYAEPPVVAGVAGAAREAAWWRSPAVYLGAVAAVVLVAGVALLLGGGESDDTGDEPEGAASAGEDAATTQPDSSRDRAGGEGDAEADADAAEPDEGEGSEPSAEPEEEGDEPEAEPDDGSPSGEEAEDRAPPSNLSVLESPVGVQLDWEGEEDGRYVILVSSDAEAPQFLPATGGPSHLVPSDLLLPDAGYCFAVAYLDDATSNPDEAGEDAAFSDPACIRDADPASVGG